MRKKLWRQFHLWTLGLLGLLTVANVASALRPFSSTPKPIADKDGTIHLVQTKLAASDRNPASAETSLAADTHLVLKTADIGCDEVQQLQVPDGIRQLRLQIQMCSSGKTKAKPDGVPDTVASVINTTNGFEATLFAATVSLVGTPQARIPAAAHTTTDYISLAPGHNEIKIQRRSRVQVLKIR